MMTESEQTILQAALSLPPSSRAQLADLLWESLPMDQDITSLDDEIRAAWVQEAKRRMKEVEEGRVELMPGEDVVERLRAKMQS